MVPPSPFGFPMVNKFLSILFAPFLIIAACASTKVPFSSIQQLSRVGTPHYCTAWATRISGLTRWVSAAHCVARAIGPDGEPTNKLDEAAVYTIGGHPAHVLKVDSEADLSLFSGPAARGLQVALGEASPGDKVRHYSFFVPEGFYAEGVAGLPDKDGFRVFNVTSGSGSSGGPVLTEDNLVVGVMQFVMCHNSYGSACPVVAGAGVKQIREFLTLDQE